MKSFFADMLLKCVMFYPGSGQDERYVLLDSPGHKYRQTLTIKKPPQLLFNSPNHQKLEAAVTLLLVSGGRNRPDFFSLLNLH